MPEDCVAATLEDLPFPRSGDCCNGGGATIRGVVEDMFVLVRFLVESLDAGVMEDPFRREADE